MNQYHRMRVSLWLAAFSQNKLKGFPPHHLLVTILKLNLDSQDKLVGF
jgi:hypothetical protein